MGAVPTSWAESAAEERMKSTGALDTADNLGAWKTAIVNFMIIIIITQKIYKTTCFMSQTYIPVDIVTHSSKIEN